MIIDTKTKIVATIGPASASVSVLRELMRAGMDVARLNFSHGSYDFYTQVIANIRDLNAELGISTAILADLQGPKLRVGEMENGSIDVPDGSELIITTEPMLGRPGMVSTAYKQFPQDVKPGEMVLLDDGKLRMQVLTTDGRTEVKLKVLSGGKLTNNKGVNLPNTKVSLPCLTDKDKKDLDFALSQDVDWVGLSFVRSARDIIELKHLIRAQDRTARVVAKIEKPEALLEIDDIIRESDALMVARGDLGVEVPMERVPLIQKDIIRRCLRSHRPVIVATQMMESMITSATPTRAEVNDVANAVLDHADAVMLSAETSVGKYPVEVVRTMNRILMEMETSDGMFNVPNPPLGSDERTISDAISIAAVRMTEAMPVKAIVTMTHSGYSAFKISSMRPRANIYAFTSNPKILCMLNLVWGVRAHYYDKTVSTDHTIADIKHLLRKRGHVEKGDLVINIASMPIAEKGMSNMLKLSPGVKKFLVALATLLCVPLIAGLYGALHDQLSFTIAPEYFTKFKYEQFGFEPQWFGGHRPTVAVIGFLATWWVGALIGLFLGGTALLQPDAHSTRKAIVRGVVITLGIAALSALIGLTYGWFFITVAPNGWYLPQNALDPHSFLAVGSMHNCSYGGGVLGLIIALTDMEWRRISFRRASGSKRPG